MLLMTIHDVHMFEGSVTLDNALVNDMKNIGQRCIYANAERNACNCGI